MLQFKIEQIAIAPRNTQAAELLLRDMGWNDWTYDTVIAEGKVFDRDNVTNTAKLHFNYESQGSNDIEFEILDYIQGDNWIRDQIPCVSHVGMHCTPEELDEWKKFFAERGILIVQEVHTKSHTNEYLIEDDRTYHYTIFGTRQILGFDIKLIVRYEGLYNDEKMGSA